MFTGLIEAQARVLQADDQPVGDTGDTVRRLRVQTPWRGDETPALGDSVAVDGTCLTVTQRDPTLGQLSMDVAAESQRRTTLGQLAVGYRVHLERALRFGDRLGGHLVSGHVDGVGEVVRSEADGASWLLEVTVPPAVRALCAPQGAITLAGVSLTINALSAHSLCVGLVPHTLAQTALGQLRPGDRINCEADLLARYIAQLMVPLRAGDS